MASFDSKQNKQSKIFFLKKGVEKVSSYQFRNRKKK